MLVPIPNARAIWTTDGSWLFSLSDCHRPPRRTTCEPLPALLCTVRVPLCTLVLVAVKRIVTSRVAPGASVNGRVGGLSSANVSVRFRPVTCIGSVPVLLIRTVPVSATRWLASAVVWIRLNATWSSNGVGSGLTTLSTALVAAGTYGLTLRTSRTTSCPSNAEPGTSSVATTYAFGTAVPSAVR